MPNEKNHLYSDADVKFDAKKNLKLSGQQQFSRFAASTDATIIDIANRSQQSALQNLTKFQIGNPYNNTIEPFGLTTEAIPFNVYGSEYSFLTITGDADIFPDGIPQGRFVEYILDIIVDTGGGPSITIQFLNVLNPPVLAGNDNDHYILKFVAVNKADDNGVDPLGELTVEFIGPVVGGGGGSGNIISQGDSNVTVTDFGSGIITMTIDGTQRYSIQANRADYANIPIFGLTDLNFNDTVTNPMVVMGASDTQFFDIKMIDVGDGLRIFFSGDNTAIFSNLNLQLLSATPNTLSAALRLFRDDPSPGISDALGSIHFDGRDDGGGFTNYATLIGGIEVVAAGNESGSLVLNLLAGGSTKQLLEMIPDIFGVNTASIRMDEINTPSNPAANRGLIYLKDVAGITTPFFLDSSGTETNMIGGGNVISQANSNVTVTDVGSGLITMDVDGSQRYSIQANRADYANIPVFGITALSFQDIIDAVAGTILTQNQTDFTMNFPNNSDTYNINFNSIVGLSVDLLRTRFHSNIPNTISSAISLFRDDPSPTIADALGDINFDGRDSIGNFTTYADIIGGIESPTSAAEMGRLTFRLQDSGSMQQVVRMSLDELELTDMSILLNEISLPTNPATNQGLIYLRDVAGTTTPFFLDSLGVETSMIAGGGGGDVFLANSQIFTGINTFNNATNGIVMTNGTKLEFENATVSNLEIHAESNLRDPGDLTITTRSGLEVDLNTGAVPDTEVFHIGDGQGSPWLLIDDTTARFNTALTGVTGHQLFLSRNNVPNDGEDISEIFAQAKISASEFLKFAFIRMTALDVDGVAANNEGQMRLGVVSNNALNTGINIQGVAGAPAVLLGFHGVTPTQQQQVTGSRGGNAALASLLTVLAAKGLIVDNTTA